MFFADALEKTRCIIRRSGVQAFRRSGVNFYFFLSLLLVYSLILLNFLIG